MCTKTKTTHNFQGINNQSTAKQLSGVMVRAFYITQCHDLILIMINLKLYIFCFYVYCNIISLISKKVRNSIKVPSKIILNILNT